MTTSIQLPQGDALTVRTVHDGDRPALQRFHSGLSLATRAVFTPHAYDDATVTRMIARAEDGADRAYVALAGDEIVAYCFLWNMADPIPSLGIGITDRFQGRGLGRELIRILVDDARAAGRAGIELTTVLANARAFALYRKAGFEYLEDVDNVAGDGRVVRERWMFLPLQPGARPTRRDHRPPG